MNLKDVCRITLLVATLALAACGRTLMPTPTIFDNTGLSPYALSPDAEHSTVKRVFVVTEREPTIRKSTTPANYYSKRHGRALRVAHADVSIGKDLTWEELLAASMDGSRGPKVPVRIKDVHEIGILWDKAPPFDANKTLNQDTRDRLVAQLEDAMDRAGHRNISIFVHGFNTTFGGNTALAGEMLHYLGDAGVIVSYAWPSQGSLLAYQKDKAIAAYSTRFLRQFIVFLGEHTSVERINIFAHSAGSVPAVETIHQLRLMHTDFSRDEFFEKYRIANFTLVAPDVDLARFINMRRDELDRVPQSMAVYTSTDDVALALSKMIFGLARLGSFEESLTTEDMKTLRELTHVQAIDVANAEKRNGSFLGHSYFHQDPWVSTDLILKSHGLTPEERGLVRIGDNPIWQFPNDYPERAANAARRIYADSPPVHEQQ